MALLVPSRVRRIAGAIVAILMFVVLAGATYQGVATALERHKFPRPGGLVDVGGHQLHIYCVGSGSPTVVLEAAAGSLSAAWARVQPEVATTTRVCSYDRSGLGWSEAGDGIYVPARVPDELHALLTHANERGPFVLVGHELGAVFARMFAARYRADVASLVLIDDPALTHPDQEGTALVGAWPWLARAGILRVTGRLSARALGLPGEPGGAMRAFLNRPDHLTRAAAEISRLGEAVGAAGNLQIHSPIAVTSVNIGDHEQPALLVTRQNAASATRAIESAVARARETSASSSHEP